MTSMQATGSEANTTQGVLKELKLLSFDKST
jgi:hypothetical protein